MPPKKKPVKKMWDFEKQGYPPGIDSVWARNETRRIGKETNAAFTKAKKEKKLPLFVLERKTLVESGALKRNPKDPKGLIGITSIVQGRKQQGVIVEMHFPIAPKFTCSAEEIQIRSIKDQQGKPVQVDHSTKRMLQEQLTILVKNHLK